MIKKLFNRTFFAAFLFFLAFSHYKTDSLSVDQYREYLHSQLGQNIFLLGGATALYLAFLFLYCMLDLFRNRRDHRFLILAVALFLLALGYLSGFVIFLLSYSLLYIAFFLYVEKYINLPRASETQHLVSSSPEFPDSPSAGIPIPALMLKRTLACLVDYGFFSIFLSAMFLIYADKASSGWTLQGLPAFFTLIVWLIYFPFVEGISGATVGKHLLKLRVVSRTGKQLRLYQAFVRHLPDFLDVLVFTTVVGIFRLTAKIPRRIGDRLAGTWVVYVAA